MCKEINSKDILNKWEEELEDRVFNVYLRDPFLEMNLLILRVGKRPETDLYVRNKIRKAEELRIGVTVFELPEDTKIGSAVIESKTVFDAGITPNRPDYLSVRGIARDLSAAGLGAYIAPSDKPFENISANRKVVLNTDKCGAYKLVEIHGITVNKSSKEIASRLAAIGINPKNAPVDATNYICYDMAQPMHCFDADQINGDIIVRMAENGEKFTDLFDNEHELTDTDMVIADASGILALAGVIGGKRGSFTENTKNIILESAYFDPVSVRKTAKRLGISTDSSL